MADFKGILFDFNGTLFFDSYFHIRAFEICFEDYGLPVKDKEFIIKNLFGRSNREIFTRFYKSDATAEEIAEFEYKKEELYRRLCFENPNDFRLCDGVCELLDFIKSRSIPCCIATGSPLENVKFYFDNLGLGKWFTMNNIVYFTGDFPGKPAPHTYLLAAERLGLRAEECVVFEDGTSGIMAANAAGAAKTIAVWQTGLPSPLTNNTKADGCYHDFTNWKQILADIGMI